MEISKIMADLLLAQKDIGVIKKEGLADAGKFSYSYAELSDVIAEIKKKLNEHNIVVLQPVNSDMVQTRLIHTSGECIQDEGVRIVNGQPDDPQAQGKAITYARRYGLMSLLCLETEDDDAKSAMPVKRATGGVEVTKSTGKTKECVKCGSEAIYKEGQNKLGKPYRAYFCDNQECKHVEWLPTETLTF
jgi:hypothetical protein